MDSEYFNLDKLPDPKADSRSDGGAGAMNQLAEKWRRLAQDAWNRTDALPGCSEVWNTCADELAALLTAPGPQDELTRLRQDQADWRKGVALIASYLGDPAENLSCARIAELALQMRARLEDAEAKLAALPTPWPQEPPQYFEVSERELRQPDDFGFLWHCYQQFSRMWPASVADNLILIRHSELMRLAARGVPK